MQGLSAAELMEVWERGTGLDEPDRALLLLARRSPGQDRSQLESLPLGERDQLLLELRRATFGDRMEAFLQCAHCHGELEFTLHAPALLSSRTSPSQRGDWSIHGDHAMRLPNSADFRAASGCGSSQEAIEVLLARCVRAVHADSGPVCGATHEGYTEQMRNLYSDWMEATAPETEISLEVPCPVCTKQSFILFDIASFFWREIEAAAGRLVREVDALARTYGWSEHEILAMTSVRRRVYLQAAGA